MNFLDAFSQAGGLEQKTQRRTRSKSSEAYRVTSAPDSALGGSAYAGPEKLNFGLEEGDIIYAPRRNLAKFGYVMQKTSSLAGFAVLGTVGAR